MLSDSLVSLRARKLKEKEVNMLTKNINQIAAQYDRIWKLHFGYDKGTEKMWQKVEEICGKFLREMTYWNGPRKYDNFRGCMYKQIKRK